MRNGWRADNIDVKISFTRNLKIPDFFFKKRYLFLTFNKNDKHRQKGNNFAYCSTENECRNLVFLLVLTNRVELFVKKYNCRNLSLIQDAKRLVGETDRKPSVYMWWASLVSRASQLDLPFSRGNLWWRGEMSQATTIYNMKKSKKSQLKSAFVFF